MSLFPGVLGWMPEVDVTYLLQSLSTSTFLSKTDSLSALRAHRLRLAGQPVSSRDLLAYPELLGLQCLTSMWVLVN